MNFEKLREFVSVAVSIAKGNGVFGEDFDPLRGIDEETIRADLDIPDTTNTEEDSLWWEKTE